RPASAAPTRARPSALPRRTARADRVGRRDRWPRSSRAPTSPRTRSRSRAESAADHPSATTVPGRRRRSLSALQARDEVVEPRARDREELREVLAIALGEGRRAVAVADGAREIRERLVQLARRGDERVVAQ